MKFILGIIVTILFSCNEYKLIDDSSDIAKIEIENTINYLQSLISQATSVYDTLLHELKTNKNQEQIDSLTNLIATHQREFKIAFDSITKLHIEQKIDSAGYMLIINKVNLQKIQEKNAELENMGYKISFN